MAALSGWIGCHICNFHALNVKYQRVKKALIRKKGLQVISRRSAFEEIRGCLDSKDFEPAFLIPERKLSRFALRRVSLSARFPSGIDLSDFAFPSFCLDLGISLFAAIVTRKI